MIRFAAIFGLLGLAAATAIIVASGYAQVLDALARAGWGIVWASLFHLVPMTCCVIGWRVLMPKKKRVSHAFLFYVLWLRSAVNNLLPAARVGGEFLAVRVLQKRGVASPLAVAMTIVETTASVLAVFLFDIIGAIMFAVHVGDRHVGLQLGFALLLSMPMVAGFIIVQRFGFFGLLTRVFTLMFRKRWTKMADDAARLDRAVHAMYRRTGAVLICGFWQFLSWLLGSGEIWLALYFLGHPLPIAESMMIEALIQTAASAAFVVPGALGVQEAGFLVFGQMLGLPPDIAVALAVMRRCRDLMLYVPGLIAWQVQEGHWLLRKKRGRTA
jgi:putative membrane protein